MSKREAEEYAEANGLFIVTEEMLSGLSLKAREAFMCKFGIALKNVSIGELVEKSW